jgi:hypothetical protein
MLVTRTCIGVARTGESGTCGNSGGVSFLRKLHRSGGPAPTVEFFRGGGPRFLQGISF